MSRHSKRVSLEVLLREGGWGPLRLGRTRQQIARHLGVPEDWMETDTERRAAARGVRLAGWALSPVLRYGAVEFHFPDDPAGVCWMIFCDDLEALAAPKAGARLRVDPWGLVEGTAEENLSAQLQAAELAFTRRPFPWDPRQVRLHLQSGATLGLTDDPPGERVAG